MFARLSEFCQDACGKRTTEVRGDERVRFGRKTAAVFALVTVSATAVSGCSDSKPKATPTNLPITLYSGQDAATTTALVAAFTAQTGIKVTVHSGAETALAQQIEQEAEAPKADVFYASNSPALEELAGKGLLTSVSKPTLGAIPPKYSSPTGSWVGVSARVSVMVYDRSRLKPSQLPKSVIDLEDDQWKNKVALAPSATDFQPVVTSVLKAKGEQSTLDWLNSVKANAVGHTYPDNATLIEKVNSGDALLGVIDSYSWYQMRDQLGGATARAAIAPFAKLDPGYIVDISPAGILKSSKRQVEAQKFLAFLVSAKGQQIIASSGSFEYPLIVGSVAAGKQPALSTLRPYPLALADLGDGTDAVNLLQVARLL